MVFGKKKEKPKHNEAGHRIRPVKGKCPGCGVPANTYCKNWCNAVDPHAKDDPRKK